MPFNVFIGFVIMETALNLALRLWRPAIILWALLGAPLAVYAVAVVIGIEWVWERR